MKKWLNLFVYCAFCFGGYALEISRGKVHIRENKRRAQLSLILQISDEDIVPKHSTYERELLDLLKSGLKRTLPKQKKLKFHKRFTHIFVTAVSNSMQEDTLAILAKTPRERYPSIHIFKRPELMQRISKVQEQLPPQNMYEQIGN